MGYSHHKSFSILQGTLNHLQLPAHVKLAIRHNPTNIDNAHRIGWEIGLFYCFAPLGNDEMVKLGIVWTDDIERFLTSTVKRWKTWMKCGFMFFAWRVVCPSLLEDDAKVWFENELQRAVKETLELFSVSHGDGVASVPLCDLLDLVIDQMTQHAVDGTGFDGQAGFERNTLIKLKEFVNVWDNIHKSAVSFLPSGIEYNDIRKVDGECVFCGVYGGDLSGPLARTLRNDEIKGKFIDPLRQSVLEEGSWDEGVAEWKQLWVDDLGNPRSQHAIGKHATVFKAPMVLERLLFDAESFRFRDHGSGGSGGSGGGSGGNSGHLGFDMGGEYEDERMSFSTSRSGTSMSLHSNPRNDSSRKMKRTKTKRFSNQVVTASHHTPSFDQLAAAITADPLIDGNEQWLLKESYDATTPNDGIRSEHGGAATSVDDSELAFLDFLTAEINDPAPNDINAVTPFAQNEQQQYLKVQEQTQIQQALLLSQQQKAKKQPFIVAPKKRPLTVNNAVAPLVHEQQLTTKKKQRRSLLAKKQPVVPLPIINLDPPKRPAHFDELAIEDQTRYSSELNDWAIAVAAEGRERHHRETGACAHTNPQESFVYAANKSIESSTALLWATGIPATLVNASVTSAASRTACVRAIQDARRAASAVVDLERRIGVDPFKSNTTSATATVTSTSLVEEQKKKKQKDPNAPARPKTAYILYTSNKDNWARVQAANPNADFGALSKLLVAEYKALGHGTERARLDRLAAEDKERYAREMKEYNSKHQTITVMKSSKEVKLGLTICRVNNAKVIKVTEISPLSLFAGTALTAGSIVETINGVKYYNFEHGKQLLDLVVGALTLVVSVPVPSDITTTSMPKIGVEATSELQAQPAVEKEPVARVGLSARAAVELQVDAKLNNQNKLEPPETVKSITSEVKLESNEPDFLTKAREAKARADAELQEAEARAAAESSVVPEPVTSAVSESVSSGGVSSETKGVVVDLTLSDDE